MCSRLPIPDDAVWIGSSHPFDLHEVYVNFRAPSLRLRTVPKAAMLYISADSRYRLWLNDLFLARGPSRCWPHAQVVDAIDLSSHLAAGDHQICAQIYQPGYSHFSYVHQAALGLIAWLEIDGHVVMVSDESWRAKRDLSYSSRVHRVSIYGSGVEDRDLRRAEAWRHFAYDDRQWEAARVVAPASSPLWSGLQPRALPFLREEILLLPTSGKSTPTLPAERLEAPPMTLIQMRSATVAHTEDPHIDLKNAWTTGSARLLETDLQKWYAVELDGGAALLWLFDLGQDYTCLGRVEVEGALGGETVWIGYQEKIRNGELIISDPDTYCRVRTTDRFRLASGATELEGFTLRGGRYLLFGVVGPTENLRIRFGVRTAHHPLPLKLRAAARDPEIEAILQLCERTFLACLQETFVDAVWRESSQWLGDALPQALILTALSDDRRLLATVVRMAAQGAYVDGLLPSILPGRVHAYAVLDYCFMWIELLDLYVKQGGGREALNEMLPILQRMLERFGRNIGEDGLLYAQKGRRLFLDWSPMSRNEPSALYNLRAIYALQRAADLVEQYGPLTWRAQARAWRNEAKALGAASRQTFYAAGRWWDDRNRTTFSQLTAAFALLGGAAKREEADDLLDAIVARSLHESDEHEGDRMVLASPFMHHYLFEALWKAGRRQAIEDIVRQRWGRWVRAGYPTCWENWNVDFPDGSQCHAFSAHPLYHLLRPDSGHI